MPPGAFTGGFMRGQLKCRHCQKFMITPELTKATDLLELMLGHEIVVTSLYRCEDYNKAINGALHSYHCLGMAVDVLCKKEDQPILIEKAKAAGFRGIGIGPNFCHLDVRLTAPASWGYDQNGRPVTALS